MSPNEFGIGHYNEYGVDPGSPIKKIYIFLSDACVALGSAQSSIVFRRHQRFVPFFVPDAAGKVCFILKKPVQGSASR